MEFIDRSKIGKQERLDHMTNEVLESLVESKQPKKYVPNQGMIEYLKSLRKNLFNKEGRSKTNSFSVVAQFPIEVHLEMTKIHGPHWTDKPGVLADFLAKNPHYRMGNPMGFRESIDLGGNGGNSNAHV